MTTPTGVVVVAVWAVAGVVLALASRPRLGVQVLAAGALGGVALWSVHDGRAVGPLVAWAVPAAVAWLALSLPAGRIGSGSRTLLASAITLVALGVGVAEIVADRTPTAVEIVAACVVCSAIVTPSVQREARDAEVTERPRLQLVAASAATTVAIALVAGAIALAADSRAAEVVFGLTFAVPAVGLVAGCAAGARRGAARAVAVAAATLSLALVVSAGQAVALLVAGRMPEGDERLFVVPSFAGAAVAAVAVVPVRRAGDALMGRWVLGVRSRPEDAARTLTERASRGVPVDELLLQLAETLRSALGAARVEVWTRPGEAFELGVVVPDRRAAPLTCTAPEASALSRVGVAGDAWLRSWVPRLLAGREQSQVRVAPAVHTSTVLGFVVVERHEHDVAFTEVDDRALAEIGRRLGEVLHARRLDAALAATLDDLRASRARLVATADAERRRIERNLHDGAQQHLVALAVSLRLARDLVRDDPDASAELLDQLADDVRDTIEQLRDLAHGIYPPLLIDSGLAEALHAAARRSPQRVEVDAKVDRHPVDVEAAVYFCCLEALQNAAKHAPDATVRLRVWDDEDHLRFEVVDDGPGFDPATVTIGHGFQNMADRLGAIGGSVSWSSQPGAGTRVVGEVAR